MSFTQLFHTLRSRECAERAVCACRGVAVSPLAFVISSCRAQTGAHKHWIFFPTHRQMKEKKKTIPVPTRSRGPGVQHFWFLFIYPTTTNYTFVVTSNNRNVTCSKWKLGSLLSSPKIKSNHQRLQSSRTRPAGPG